MTVGGGREGNETVVRGKVVVVVKVARESVRV